MTIEISTLIQRFEHDMQFDCHHSATKVGRSDAAWRLIDMGTEALPQIVAHLETNPPNQQLGIHTCWGMLLHDIAIGAKCIEWPNTYEDTTAWIAWAKRIGASNG